MNLKTAARRLGVHYQTAYRWVRSGQLVAVKVGSGYEISEAALDRFLARRAAAERVPERGLHEREHSALLPAGREEALAVLDRVVNAATIDPRPVDRKSVV